MALTLDEVDLQIAAAAQLMRQALTSNCLDIYDKYADRRDTLLDARSILMAARDRDRAAPLAG